MTSPASSMRLLLVAGCAFPAPRGSQVLIDQMARCLAASGAAVDVVAPGATSRAMAGYRFHAVKFRNREPVELAATRVIPIARASAILAVARATRQFVDTMRPHVVHAHNFEGLLAALLARGPSGHRSRRHPPIVFHCHGLLGEELPVVARSRGRRGAAGVVGTWMDVALPRLADRVVVLSSDVGEWLLSHGVERERIEVIAPGLDAAGLPDPPQERRCEVVFCGNLDRYQNIESLLDAWPRVRAGEPRARLRLVAHATAPDVRRLERELVRRGVDGSVAVIRAGSVAAAVPELIRARVGVSPRTTWSGFPIKHLNYMAAGLPIVATTRAGKGVVAGKNGALAPEDAPEELAASLLTLLTDPWSSAQLGQGGRDVLAQDHAPGPWSKRLLASGEASLALRGEPPLLDPRVDCPEPRW